MRSLSLARMKPTPRIVGRRRGERRDHGQRGHEIGEVGHVDVDAAQRLAVRGRTVVPVASRSTVQPISPSRSSERGVALQRRAAEAGTCTVPPQIAAAASG